MHSFRGKGESYTTTSHTCCVQYFCRVIIPASWDHWLTGLGKFIVPFILWPCHPSKHPSQIHWYVPQRSRLLSWDEKKASSQQTKCDWTWFSSKPFPLPGPLPSEHPLEEKNKCLFLMCHDCLTDGTSIWCISFIPYPTVHIVGRWKLTPQQFSRPRLFGASKLFFTVQVCNVCVTTHVRHYPARTMITKLNYMCKTCGEWLQNQTANSSDSKPSPPQSPQPISFAHQATCTRARCCSKLRKSSGESLATWCKYSPGNLAAHCR